jgi:nucleotide-binding universal stress UspA family protein
VLKLIIMGKIFANILVPFDNSSNSKRALTIAIKLAVLSNATITLVHAISYHSAMAKIVQPYKGKMISHVKKFLKDAKHSAFKEGLLTNQHILYGNPSEELLDLMKKKKFDLVVMGRRGTTKITGPSLGSVSNALVQGSKVPVLIVN